MEEDRLDFNSFYIPNYYIVIRDTILKYLKGKYYENIIRLDRGSLISAIAMENSIKLDEMYNDTQYKFNNTEWTCCMSDLRCIAPLIFKLLCSITNLEERIRLVKNKQFCKDVEDIQIGSKVLYRPDPKHEGYLVSVKYINYVQDLGDGYYFGLDLLDYPHICENSNSRKQYFQLFNSPGIFTTLSQIEPHKVDRIKNFEKNFLCNDILQPQNTDNLFVTKSKEDTDSKKSLDILKKSKLPFIDTDNNNQIIGHKDLPITYNITNYEVKNTSEKYQNHNKKLDRNLIIFDPLNPDYEVDEVQPKNIQHFLNPSGLKIKSYVQVFIKNVVHYGTIRWIGYHEGSNKLMAAIELDDIHPLATHGTYQNIKYCDCNSQKVYFTDLKNCHQYDMAASSFYYAPQKDFELVQSSDINKVIQPITVTDSLNRICGKYRGIQGHHNSCYLDATLFSMFAFTSVFDNLLTRPPNEKDCPQYEEVQRVLREEIVNPLRRDIFVEADHVMKLRTLLEKSSSISGLTSEEKDPEEFLTSLVAQTLNAEPFLKLSSGQDAYHYQLFVEKDDELVFPSVQQLLEQSFLTSNIKLKEVPSCLIIQMPRFGKSYKMYSKIQPTLLLDVTDIIENSPRQCTVCGDLAKFECKECYGQLDQGLESTAFCSKCVKKAHCHERRTNHEPNTLSVPTNYELLKNHCPVQRLYLELLAVVCIETSHYVSFVKCAPGSDAPWCFFDSMADRKGEQNGHNIPEIMQCPDFSYWLSKEGASELAAETNDRILSGYAKRLLCDAYMCMYQSTDVMYK